MKTFFFITLLSIVFINASCDTNVLEDKNIEILEIASDHTSEDYRMRILLPDEYDASKTYPVIYLIDGYFWFDYVAGELVKSRDAGEISDVIIVGIEYSKYPVNVDEDDPGIAELRLIDLTYPEEIYQGTSSGGGAILFYNFIKSEMIPLVENKYSIDASNRSLFGHSLGGYFALFQLLNFKEDRLFKNVVASSPSVWWERPFIHDLEGQVSESEAGLAHNLYLSIGTEEGDEFNQLFDMFTDSVGIHNYADLNYQVDKYPTGHSETGVRAFKDALKIIYAK